MIFIEKSKKADFKMRIFNPDGSEAEMCGNGIRCAALYKGKKRVAIETLAGFLLGQFGNVPKSKEIIAWNGYEFLIEKSTKKRIHQVRIIKKK